MIYISKSTCRMNRRKTSIRIKMKTHVIQNKNKKHIYLVINSILEVLHDMNASYPLCLVSFKIWNVLLRKCIKLSRLKVIAMYVLLKSSLLEIKFSRNCPTSKIYRPRTFTQIHVYINRHFMVVIKQLWYEFQINLILTSA